MCVCFCRFVTHSFTSIFCEYRKHLRITRLRHILRVSVCAVRLISLAPVYFVVIYRRGHTSQKAMPGQQQQQPHHAVMCMLIHICECVSVCVLYLYFINQLNTRELAPPQQQQPPQTTAPLRDDNAFNHNNNNATTKARLREQTNNTQKKHTNNLVYVNIISLYFVTASATVHAFCWRVLVCTMWV